MNLPAPRHGPGTKIGLASLAAHPERIDVRSPAEFAIDHIPGAVNLPVLTDEERKQVGTLHAQESAFAARKLGAALVARNIAGIVETYCRPSRATGHRSSIAGAAASAARRSPTCSMKSAGAPCSSTAATAPGAGMSSRR